MPIEYKCEICGKVFNAPSRLHAHKTKKLPCALPTPINIQNPNTCQYCNKTYNDRSYITKHYKICRKKIEHDSIQNNNKIEANVYKNMFEEEREELKREREEHKKQITEFMQIMQKMVEKQPTTVVNGDVNTINNNITLNNYTEPTPPNISFEEIKDCDGLHKLVLEKTYFNKELPQNLVLNPVNKSTQNRCLEVYDKGGWQKLVGKPLDEALKNIIDKTHEIGKDILKNNRQIYVDAYNQNGRPVEFKTRTANFFAREETVNSNELFEMTIQYAGMIKK